MAGEKRPFPFSEYDKTTQSTSINQMKRQCISSNFLKKHNNVIVSSQMNGLEESCTQEIGMEYENSDFHHQNGQITFEDFQNGQESQVECRLENGYSPQTNYGNQNGHSLETDYVFQNGHSLSNGIMNNNNNDPRYSVCIRCQAGEPGHIGHIGR